MAYTHSRYEVEMRGAADVSAVGLASVVGQMGHQVVTNAFAEWGPGFVPHLLKAAALIMTGTNAGLGLDTPLVVRFEGDISVPGTVTTLFSIHLPSAPTAHQNFAIYHIPTYAIEISPGKVVQCRATTVATGGARVRVMLYVEPRWEEPANVTTMSRTT